MSGEPFTETPAPPRRLTAAWIIERLTEHRSTAPRVPELEISQTKSVGGAVVYEWSVKVPVCDEYPTADDAFQAATKMADDLRKAYPPPADNGEKK